MVNKFYEQNKNNLLLTELFSFAIRYARNQLETGRWVWDVLHNEFLAEVIISYGAKNIYTLN